MADLALTHSSTPQSARLHSTASGHERVFHSLFATIISQESPSFSVDQRKEGHGRHSAIVTRVLATVITQRASLYENRVLPCSTECDLERHDGNCGYSG